MYRQTREAAQSMRRDGIDLPSASWTPPREYVPDPNPSPYNPNWFGSVPAFLNHPICDPTVQQLHQWITHSILTITL
eukprot:3179916-Pyramimonas_sp.AAC.1